MLRIIKWLLFLVIFAGIALIAYAYVGPFLGADFAPPLREVTTPITLDAN